jgi:choice-of-anchor A domain-containing protein
MHKVNKFLISSLSALCIFCSSAFATTIDLGAATGFNIFVKNDFIQPGADSQGRIAVGGNANIGQYDVGVNYDSSYGSSGIQFWKDQSGYSDVLIVGGDLKTTGWGNIKGNAIVGGSISDVSGHSAKGYIQKSNPIDFTAEFNALTGLSINLSTMNSNASVDFKYNNWIILKSDFGVSSSDVVYANVSGEMLKNATDFSAISLRPENTLIVNVSGKDIHFDSLNYGQRESLSALDMSPGHILFNFYEAENLTFDYGGFRGNILAPNANFKFQSGDLSGQVIAKSWTGNWGAQANLWDGLFVPPIVNQRVEVIEPSSLAILLLSFPVVLLSRKRRLKNQ